MSRTIGEKKIALAEAETEFLLALPLFLIRRIDTSQSWGQDLIKLPPIAIKLIEYKTPIASMRKTGFEYTSSRQRQHLILLSSD